MLNKEQRIRVYSVKLRCQTDVQTHNLLSESRIASNFCAVQLEVRLFLLGLQHGRGCEKRDQVEADLAADVASDEDDYKPFVSLRQRKEMLKRQQETRKKRRKQLKMRKSSIRGPYGENFLIELSTQQQPQDGTQQLEVDREEQRLLEDCRRRHLSRIWTPSRVLCIQSQCKPAGDRRAERSK